MDASNFTFDEFGNILTRKECTMAAKKKPAKKPKAKPVDKKPVKKGK